MTYLDQRRKFIEAGRPLKEKKKYVIPKVSEKRKAKLDEQKENKGDSGIDIFFERNRKRMVGVCQCGCARKSSKSEDDHYRSSISHIFPKRIFLSISTNDMNWVERNFWDGCHTNMDNKSMDLWVNMADWDDIKEKFHILAPLLTDQERAKKFYSHLEKLIYKK